MAADLDILVDDLPAAQRSLRLSVVTETYPPDVNGVSLSVARLVDGLRARNHAVQLVRLRQNVGDAASWEPGEREVLFPGLPIPRYPHLKMGVPNTRALTALWTRHRPDLVHIATEGPLGWSALRAARRLKLPVISEFRTNFHAYSQHYGLGWLNKPILAYLRKFHNLTQRTLVPTTDLQRELQQRGFERVNVLARGVDTALFTPKRRDETLRATWGAGPDTVVLLCVGRLAAEKNLGLVQAAWQAALSQGRDVVLVMVGDGPLRSTLARQWPGACFLGQLRGTDLARAYASADLFAFPSLTETYGNVVPEAMASGLAVVAFDCAAASALIEPGISGDLAPSDQPSRWVDSVCRLAVSVPVCQDMGRRARGTALALGWDRIVGELEQVMLDVLDDPGLNVPALHWQPLMN